MEGVRSMSVEFFIISSLRQRPKVMKIATKEFQSRCTCSINKPYLTVSNITRTVDYEVDL